MNLPVKLSVRHFKCDSACLDGCSPALAQKQRGRLSKYIFWLKTTTSDLLVHSSPFCLSLRRQNSGGMQVTLMLRRSCCVTGFPDACCVCFFFPLHYLISKAKLPKGGDQVHRNFWRASVLKNSSTSEAQCRCGREETNKTSVRDKCRGGSAATAGEWTAIRSRKEGSD